MWGVGLAMASDILHVCYPAEFTILDYRAWRALWPASVEGPSRRCPRTAGDYLQYCLACRELATQSGLSLRSLDHALWAKSWEDDLLALVDEGQPLPPVGARSAAQMTPAPDSRSPPRASPSPFLPTWSSNSVGRLPARTRRSRRSAAPSAACASAPPAAARRPSSSWPGPMAPARPPSPAPWRLCSLALTKLSSVSSCLSTLIRTA